MKILIWLFIGIMIFLDLYLWNTGEASGLKTLVDVMSGRLL
ncbi:putative LemA family protein [Vibrio virus VPMCC5]|nr:putative LemA family protein [Vibrio virus VPMCC5]